MKYLAAAALLSVGCIAPAWAQDGSGNLRSALSLLPAGVFAAAQPDFSRYLDLSLLAGMHGGTLEREALMRAQTGRDLRPIDALATAGPDEWSAKAGIDLADLRFVAGTGQPPQDVVIWGFADAEKAASAFAALPDLGFDPLDGQPEILANGEEGHVNLLDRDPASPWSGMLGQTSVVRLEGPAFLHGASQAAFAPLIGSPSIADSPTGQVLLAGLEAGPGGVVQALFFGPALGLTSGIDPALFLGKSPGEARAALEEAMADPVPGVPPYGGAALADLETPDGPVMLLALAYPDCTIAEAAARQAAELWPQSARGSVQGSAEPSHVEAGEAGCAAVISVPGGAGNEQFTRAFTAMMQRNLAPIRIGLE